MFLRTELLDSGQDGFLITMIYVNKLGTYISKSIFFEICKKIKVDFLTLCVYHSGNFPPSCQAPDVDRPPTISAFGRSEEDTACFYPLQQYFSHHLASSCWSIDDSTA